MPPFATGLQELLCEGSFLDVRISCSDHSPSDGLGSHKVVLAGASTGLLGDCLDTGEEEDMICILLPDYPSSLVASVLSILYYGEVWLSQLSTQIDTVNSLFNSLGLDMLVVSTGTDLKLVKKSLYTGDSYRSVKKEPKPEPETPLRTVKIKKEETKEELQQRANFIPSIQTATIQPLSLLKCPNYSCEFHAETIPDMQTHIYECKQNRSSITESTHHVDVEQGNFNIKREQTVGVKQESVDPLERKVEVPIHLDTSINSTPVALKVQNLKFEAESEDEDVDDPGSVEVSEGSRVQCVKCPYTSSSLSALHAHASMHQRKEMLKKIKNICPVCGVQCAHLSDLKTHIFDTYARHDFDASSCSCSLRNCSKVMEGNSSQLSQLFYHHILYDHYGSKYKLKCEFCNFKAITTSKLKDHMMQHGDERPFNCDICSNAFRTRRHLKEHKTTVHSTEKPVQCSDCTATFASQQLYRRHAKLKHTNQQYSCDICKKLLSGQNALRCHMKNVHSAKDVGTPICHQCGRDSAGCGCDEPHERTVFCPECGKEMFSKNLAGHLHYHRQSSLRPYICQECSKTFTHAASLKRHALLHTGEMRFGCEQCGKQFYQKTALETHLKSHSTERLSCEGCQQRFLTRYLLNFHLKSRKKCSAAYNL